ncbi:hypothetical protein B0J17DRAFT_346164 [Rhizoctonia solani]|nr:hypothetical protein B0J17DRAFT_346164 [Rhizoctonia solani]
MSSPELLLGHNRVYQISIVGNSGSGKSTLGRYLSKHLQIPHLSIDELFWNPGWVPTQSDVLRDQVQAFIESNPGGWIVDGNYIRMIGPIVQDAATDVLWLDPPLIINFWWVLRRTFCRLFLGEPSCAPGCHEEIRETLGSKDSILLYSLSHHGICRAEFGPIWERESIEAGKGKWRRFGGWGGDLGRWLGQVTSNIRTR